MSGVLSFDAATHTFTRDGILVPSVTQVIAAAGLVRDYGNGATCARDRGVRVHEAAFLFATEDEDAALAVLEDEDVLYFDALRHWMLAAGVEVLGAEELVDGGSYAGWRDLRVRLRGHDRPVVVDLKTGQLPKWVGLQLAAYALTLPEPHDRMAVRLTSEGTASATWYRRATDAMDFRSCVRVWQLQQEMR
jgi:hypothetical protein